MAVRDTGTEQLIKDTSKHIFFVEGNLLAITQDIAQAAGVNRTSLNYYFRSRDVLVEKVFNEAMQDLIVRLEGVLESRFAFRKKIENLIDVFLTEASAHPFQEIFIIAKMNCQKCEFPVKFESEKIKAFVHEVKEEMDAGHIQEMNPIQFIINLFSMINYPLIMSPLYKPLFDICDEEFNILIAERKSMIIKMIFK